MENPQRRLHGVRALAGCGDFRVLSLAKGGEQIDGVKRAHCLTDPDVGLCWWLGCASAGAGAVPGAGAGSVVFACGCGAVVVSPLVMQCRWCRTCCCCSSCGVAAAFRLLAGAGGACGVECPVGGWVCRVSPTICEGSRGGGEPFPEESLESFLRRGRDIPGWKPDEVVCPREMDQRAGMEPRAGGRHTIRQVGFAGCRCVGGEVLQGLQGVVKLLPWYGWCLYWWPALGWSRRSPACSNGTNSQLLVGPGALGLGAGGETTGVGDASAGGGSGFGGVGSGCAWRLFSGHWLWQWELFLRRNRGQHQLA